MASAYIRRLKARRYAAWRNCWRIPITAGKKLAQLARANPVVAYPDEPLRVVVYRMAETVFTRMPVVRGDARKLVGKISLEDSLHARTRNLTEELSWQLQEDHAAGFLHAQSDSRSFYGVNVSATDFT